MVGHLCIQKRVCKAGGGREDDGVETGNRNTPVGMKKSLNRVLRNPEGVDVTIRAGKG